MRASAAIGLALFCAACSNGGGKTTVSDGGDGGGTPPPDSGSGCAIASCTGNNADTCPTQTGYACQSGCCVALCQSAADCANEACATAGAGCLCENGTCQPKPCSADVDCPTGVCIAGACVPAATAAARCVVTPSLFVARAGVPVHLAVTAFGADGGVVRTGVAPSFAVSDSVGTVDATGAFTDSQPSLKAGDVTVTSTIGGASCTAQTTVYGPARGAQVTVIDGNTALPVTDATIVISSASDGTLLGNFTVGGDALGRYAIDPDALAVGGMITVFEQGYAFLSAVAPGYADGGTFGTLPDLVFVLTQTGPFDDGGVNAPYQGGFTGDFASGPFADSGAMSGTLLFGMAGTALDEDPAAFSLVAFLGPTVATPLGADTVEVPVGCQIDFGGSPLSCGYEGLGPAGGCGVAVLDGDAGAFTCGQRPSWGIGGPVPFNEIQGLLGSGAAPTIGEILTAAAPAFPAFSSAAALDVGYTLAPPLPASQVPSSCTPGMSDTGSTPLPDPSKLTTEALGLDTPVGLVADVTLPPLPALSGTCVSNAVVLAGAVPPQIGLLPLGLSAATIISDNGVPSQSCLTYDAQGQADGQVAVSFAPAHAGFEGMPYAVMALAGIDSATGSISALIQTFTDLPYGSGVTFGGASFLGFADSTTYTSPLRAFTLGDGLEAPPTLYRLRMVQSGGGATGPNGQWVVLVPPGSPPITLPIPPNPFVDRTLGAALTVEALQLAPSATSTALVDFAVGPLEMTLMEQLTAFSSADVTVVQ